MSPSQNERLKEKLKAMASKRGGKDSPQAEELERQSAAGAPAEAPKGETEKQPKKQESKQ